MMIATALLNFASQRNAPEGYSNKKRTGRRDGTGKAVKKGESRNKTNKRYRRSDNQEMKNIVRDHNAQQPEFSALA